MNKRLVIIGIQEENLLYLKMQMEYIFDEVMSIKGLTLKELNHNSLFLNDVVLLSTIDIRELVKPFLQKNCIVMVAERTINIVNLKKLLNIKKRKNILIVNDNYESTIQTVDTLRNILPNHRYYPYSIKKQVPQNLDFVVTPGEENLIPAGFPQVLDIGPRVIALETLMELKKHFHSEITDSLLVQLYIKTMVYLTSDNNKTIPTTINNQNQRRTFSQLITKSPFMKSTIDIARQIIQTSNTIHIEGEVGTGKQMLAEMIHNASSNTVTPFYIYNCSDKEPQLIEEELFGNKNTDGLVTLITSGTLYIKNVDQLPYLLQGKLYHLIEMINENKQTNKIKIVTASLKSLSNLFQNELIRTDIYSYLSPYVLKMPSLSERKEDISILINAFKKHFNKMDLQLADGTMKAFHHYNWPGNVRELYNVISYCVCLQEKYIEPESLPLFFKGIQRNLNNEKKRLPTELNTEHIINEIEQHGFLSESIILLKAFKTGKQQNKSYGRSKVKTLLSREGVKLTDQQLRLRIEILNELGLLNVRIGRAGTTISEKGERFLHMYETSPNLSFNF